MENGNRRLFTRLPFQKRAELKFNNSQHQVKNIINLSVGGCLLDIEGPLPTEAECFLIIPLHHMAPNLEITGKIIRSDEKETTLRFISITPENLNHLHNIIRYNATNADIIDDEIKNHPGLVI